MREVHDPYRVLGLSRDATSAEIKAAHRRLAKRHHPDATEGDTERFLAIQDAYRILIDPARRREWDRQHAPGPVRASDASAVRGSAPKYRRAGSVSPDSSSRRTPASSDAAGRRDGADEGDREPWNEPYPGTGGYTWSAREVPWWEDPLAPREARRPPGRRRPTTPRPGAAPAEEDRGRGTSSPPDSGAASHADAPDGRETVAADMDVYNRSSGAAWSQAARAYFRRHDLPPPGRRSAWRGRVPTDTPGSAGSEHPGAARGKPTSQPPAGAPGPEPTAASSAPPAARTFSRSRARAAGTPAATAGAGASRPPVAAPRTRRTPAPAPWPTRPVARVRAAFPTFAERAVLAGIAWLPIAIVLAYAGGALTGCGRAAASCSPLVEPLQLALAGAAFVGLLAAPRLAWFGATGAVASLAAGMALLFALAAIGVELALAGSVLVAISVGVYATAVAGAMRDWPFPRPWLTRPAAAAT